MEEKQFHIRVRGVLFVLIVLFLTFASVLYNLQVVHGAEYLEQSVRKIANLETVEAARGDILDRYGRVLVSNRTSYQVTLDASLLGAEEKRNATLQKLLTLCRAQGIVWTDTLPVSATEPFIFTLDTASSTARSRFAAMMDTMRKVWSGGQVSDLTQQGKDENTATGTPDSAPLETVSADTLIDQMRTYFLVDPALSPAEGRALVGVLYEMALRSKDVATSDYVLAEDVNIEFISKVKEQRLVGVKIDAVSVREYNTPYAAHLLGRVGLMSPEEWKIYASQGYAMNDSVGKDGAELAFESALRGEAGQRSIETNTNGKAVSETWIVEPQPGDNAVITLDIRLQEVLERSFAQRVPSLSDQVRGASGVVIDVRDGGVLAMASYPTFSLANFSADYAALSTDTLNPLYNRATMGLYSPGSVFKMVVGAAGLEERIVTPKDEIYDTGSFQYPKGQKYPYGDYHPRCWISRQYGGTHQWESLSEAIKDSCNIYFYTVGDRLGIDKIDQYAKMFGLGKKTGIELPESVGMVASPTTSEALKQRWEGGDLLSASIGQGNTLSTPVQLANYIATLVNGGDHYPVHLLRSVKSSDYSQQVSAYQAIPTDKLDIAPANLNAIKQGMYLVATEGVGVFQHFKGLDVSLGAKTGSAQVSAASETNAVFVCFAPYEDPQIAIALVAEKGGSGGGLAAIAADILTAYFNGESTIESVSTENTLLR